MTVPQTPLLRMQCSMLLSNQFTLENKESIISHAPDQSPWT